MIAAARSGPPPVQVRGARAGDSAGLIDLASACPMEGAIGLAFDRAPDFTAALRAGPGRFELGVAERDGELAGCVAVAERPSLLHGAPAALFYGCDLKVHPGLRGTGTAQALIRWVCDRVRDRAGSGAPILTTVLAGNAPMERLCDGAHGVVPLERFATLRNFAIPVVRRRSRVSGLSVTEAQAHEVEEMADLWSRVAPQRQLAPALDAAALAAAAGTPGLSLDRYLLARGADGRLRGFIAVWDTHALKRLRVIRWSPRLRAVRALLNLASPLTGAARLPGAGEPLRAPSVLHLCVPGDDPGALRALLLAALARLRGTGAHLLNLGLDARDPLQSALGGLWAQPTAFHACLSTPAGRWTGAPLDDRPLHFEVSLA